MKTIFKYPFTEKSAPWLCIPLEAEVLHVGCQRLSDTMPTVWAAVDPAEVTNQKELTYTGTGMPVSEQLGRYLGTAVCLDGALVWHVYDVATQGGSYESAP